MSVNSYDSRPSSVEERREGAFVKSSTLMIWQLLCVPPSVQSTQEENDVRRETTFRLTTPKNRKYRLCRKLHFYLWHLTKYSYSFSVILIWLHILPLSKVQSQPTHIITTRNQATGFSSKSHHQACGRKLWKSNSIHLVMYINIQMCRLSEVYVKM
jgi:hypothetical protein